MTIRSSGQTTITKLKNAIQSLIATKANKTNGVSEITDSNSDDYTHIATMQSGATQQTINDGINIELGKCVQKSQTSGLLKNDGTIDTSSKENISNKVSSWSGTVTNDHYPSEKLVKESLNGKVDTNDSRLTDARTPTSHTHGNISNAGAIGSDSGKIITTTTNGVLTASDTITKSKISDFPSSMTPTSHTHGNVQNDGKILNSNNSYGAGVIISDTNGKLMVADSLTNTRLKDANAHSNIGSSANATQGTINTAIDTALGNKANSAHTHTKSEITDFPTSMAPTSHTHGDITNDGKLGTTSGKPLITTTGGKIATGAFGTSSGQFAEGNHTHSNYLTSHNPIDSSLSSTSTNAVQNKVINTALSEKASSDHNHDGTYLKSYTPPTGSTSQAGILQLEDSYSSTSTTKAATPNAVKAAYDKGNHSHSSYVNPTIATNLTTNDDTQVLSAKQGKILQDNKLDATTAASTYQPKGNYLTNTSGAVTIEKATSNIDGNLARYTIKQGGTALTNGVIDIPKDFLVKSGAVHTVGGSATGDKTASQLGTGYSTGDKYIDFVINTKGNDGTDEHIYINVKDLVDSTVTISRNLTSGTKIGTITINGVATDLYCETNTNTTYTADESTLTKSSGDVFSIKDGGVTSTKIADGTIVNADISSSAAISTSKISGLSTVATSGKASDLTNDNDTFATGNHNHTGTYVDGTSSSNTTNGSAIAKIKANNTEKGTIYHPKILNNTVSSGLYKITVNTDGHITGTASVEANDLPSHTHDYLTSNDISSKADITQSITNGDTTHSPSGDAIYDALALKANTSGLATVATTGKASDLTNDNDTFATGNHNHSGVYQPVGSYEVTTNIVTSSTGISSSSTDTQYPSAKATYDAIDNVLDNIILQLRS